MACPSDTQTDRGTAQTGIRVKPSMRKTVRTIALALAATLTLAACGSGEVVGPPEDSVDEPLIQVSSEGGFVPVEFNIARGPTFTVTRDKQFIFPGVTTLEYPGALIPAVFAGELTVEQYDQIVKLVEDMGIEEMDNKADNSVTNVADASTEVIRYWDQEGVHTYSVYALGISDQPQSDETAAFAELFDYLHQLSGTVTGTPYEPKNYRVVASPSYAEQDPNFVDIRPWPFEGDNPNDWEILTTVGEQTWTCKAFDPATVSALSDATQATLWMDPSESGDAQNIQILVRPLHPGEEDCVLG